MFIKKGVFINWGNIPQLEFDFGPINLFSGGNGSGKTTAADAIQALMTAAHDNLFAFNPGQDETTQKGRGGKQVRTIASYVLGCDDGSYGRPWATDGYVVAVFHPTQGESAPAFTAIMGMRAHLDRAGAQAQARLDELIFFIVPEEELSLDHFIKEYPDGRHVVPVTGLAKLLKQQYGEKSVEVYDKKRPYLRRLYGALRGKRDAVSDREAMHAAKTFSSFMAYKPVKSINEFVAQEILEKKDLGDAIRSVSDLMKTIHGMESESRQIAETLAVLGDAMQYCNLYQNQWIDLMLLNYQEAKRESEQHQKQYVSTRKEQKQLQGTLADLDKKISVCEERKKQSHRDMVQMEAQRQGVKALQDKDALENSIEHLNQQLVSLARPLLEQDQQLDRNRHNTERLLQSVQQVSVGVDVPELEDKAFTKIGKQLQSVDEKSHLDIQKLMGKDWVDIAPLEEHLDEVIDNETIHNQWAYLLHDPKASRKNLSIRDQVSRLVSQSEQQVVQFEKQARLKAQEITSLESKKIIYPPYVEAALRAIQEQCPQSDPRVLCDYVEVSDAKWQMAIEGYVGGARFSILVEPEYEAEAITIVRSMPGSNRVRARVIQGSKAKRDADRFSPVADSVLEVMEFSHKTAEYYISASYGNVCRVPDAKTLRTTARGITPDGLAAGSYSMWRCDLPDSELVFGQGARERALLAKEKEYEKLVSEATRANDRYNQYNRIFELIDGIKPVNYSVVIENMLSLHRQLKQAESSLEHLDLADYKAMEEQLDSLREQFESLEAQNKSLITDKGKTQQKLNQIERQLQALGEQQDGLTEALEQQEELVKAIESMTAGFNADERLQQADNAAQAAGADIEFSMEVNHHKQRLDQLITQLQQSIMRHNQQCQSHDVVAYEPDYKELHSKNCFKRISSLLDELDNLHNRLKNNVLAAKQEQLTKLKESFNTAFVTNLCHSIYQSINDGKRILDDLNKELEGHRFGADQERFFFDYQWVPEYKDYWRFFKEVIAIPMLGDGVTLFNAQLSEAGQTVRDKLMSMLLDDDEHKALRELERISDYRKYRNYEIYKEPLGKTKIALSKYGTGSGGQLETPAYIIRSAAITSAFRFNEGNSHLRMVLVDEAFSKMDETRSREVIHYLTQTLGLQLVFIMPTSKSGPFMDLISNQFVFSKCPSPEPRGELKTRVFVDRKQCNEEKIAELWAQHRKTIKQQSMLDFMEEFA